MNPGSGNLNPDPAGLKSEAKAIIGGKEITVSARDLKKDIRLGQGYYGYVDRMVHRPTNRVFAVKHIPIHQDNPLHPQIMKDLTVGMRSQCASVVTCHCGLSYDGEVLIVMELMDISLDKLLNKLNAAKLSFPEPILAYISHSVVTGLEYLHRQLRVMHRDVKPSNILADRHGQVKVCDFGISGDLVDSHAKTNLGTNTYLAPERIDSRENRGYRIVSDVWSFGLSVLELATGKPAYPGSADVFQQLTLVVYGDPPRLPDDSAYSDRLRSFIASCLVKNEDGRADYLTLLQSEFLSTVDCKKGAEAMQKFIRPFLDLSPPR